MGHDEQTQPNTESEVEAGVKGPVRRWFRPYLPLAVATFVVGALTGALAMVVASPAALAAAAESFGSPQLFPDRLTTWTIFTNNVIALAVLSAGAVTFSATTVFGLLFNGLLLGVILYLGAVDGEPIRTLALIVPHGVFEFAALFTASAVAYRITWRLVEYLRGQAASPLTRREVVEAGALLALSVVVLAVAAWIEATLTLPIARALVGGT